MRVNQSYRVVAFPALLLLAFTLPACGRDSTAPPLKTGAIEITVTTTSSIGDVDVTGYRVSIDNGAAQAVGVPARIRIDGLSKAQHTIMLSGLAAKCGVTSGNPLTVDLNPDLGTLLVTFEVACTSDGPYPWDY